MQSQNINSFLKIITILLFAILLTQISIFCVSRSYVNSLKNYEKKRFFYQQNIASERKTKSLAKSIAQEIHSAPIPISYFSSVSYEDTFGAARAKNTTYNPNATRIHEGCDIMYEPNRAGEVPIVSMTDGVVEQMGWLTLGGYRVGIRSESGVYYYYAHMAQYREDLSVGDMVRAGELLGFMGDTGYGEEGTTGQFPVHLHLGIYIPNSQFDACGLSYPNDKFGLYFARNKTPFSATQDVAINPYFFVKNVLP